MKKFVLITAISALSLAVGGCPATDVAKTPDASADKTAAADKPEDSGPKEVLKAGDVTADRKISVKAAVDSALADQEVWKGKEITVEGYVTSASGGGESYDLKLKTDRQADPDAARVTCYLKGSMPEGMTGKTVIVKGIIKTIGPANNVILEPCERKEDDSADGGNGSSAGGKGAPSPSEAVRIFAAGMKEKDPEKVKSVLTVGSLKMLETGARNEGAASIEEFIKSGKGTEGFSIDGEFRNEKIDGDKATLEVRSKGKWEPVTVVRENGAWKIAFDQS